MKYIELLSKFRGGNWKNRGSKTHKDAQTRYILICLLNDVMNESEIITYCNLHLSWRIKPIHVKTAVKNLVDVELKNKILNILKNNLHN